MAEGKVKIDISIPGFLTDTRARSCRTADCEFNKSPEGAYECKLKEIEINAYGGCCSCNRRLPGGTPDEG